LLAFLLTQFRKDLAITKIPISFGLVSKFKNADFVKTRKTQKTEMQ
jgi:hypothetical protein